MNNLCLGIKELRVHFASPTPSINITKFNKKGNTLTLVYYLCYTENLALFKT